MKSSEIPNKEPKHLHPLALEVRRRVQVGIREGSKTVDWINGNARERTSRGAIEGVQRQLRDWWSDQANMTGRESDWAVHIVREH